MRLPSLLPVLVLACLTVAAGARAQQAVLKPAAVAAGDHYAVAAAAAVLKDGGNAVDAMVASAFVLAVTLPEAGNIAGGGFMTAYMNGEPVFLDFRETAPAAATRDMYLDAAGQFVQRRAFLGAQAVAVPGTVRGMNAAHRRFGTLPWSRLLAPAVRLAEQGFEVTDDLAALREDADELFGDATNFKQYFSGLQAGTMFRQPLLAQTLRRLAHDPEDFYTGQIAQQLVATVSQGGGLVTAEDLAAYQPVWRQPLQADWRGHSVISAPPPSSGGIALTQLLIQRDALAPLFAGVDHNSSRYVHLLAEMLKRVFADRAEYLGDPDFVDVPTARLIDPDYVRRRAATVNPEAISDLGQVRPGLDSPDTTHLSIIDSHGNAVAMTYTLNWEFGCGLVVEEAGFLLNNEMDDFSGKPGAKNIYGAVGGDANAIAPGKRMLSSMTPTILVRDEAPVMVVGAMGGTTIFGAVMQVILNVFDYDMSAAQAVAAARFHHQLPGSRALYHERDSAPGQKVVDRLKGYGYRLEPYFWGDIAGVQLVLRAADGSLDAAGDPRLRATATVIELPARGSAKP